MNGILIGLYLAIFVVIIITIWIVEDMSNYMKINKEFLKEQKKRRKQNIKGI